MGTRIFKALLAVVFMVSASFCLTACFVPQESVPEEALYVREGLQTASGEYINLFNTEPVRGEARPLRYRRGSFEFRCSECHRDFTNLRGQSPEGEHKALVKSFSHGMNTACLNCHHKTDRNAYTDHDGRVISSDDSPRLCAKCHGPTYRDWQLGMHGRKNGYWDTNKGQKTRLECIQCHDPHNPAFPLMKPDPAPIYSRFTQHQDSHDTESVTP